MPTIKVSRQGSGNSTNLRLIDDVGDDGVNTITTDVSTNDTVTWIVDTDPPNGATQIYSIENVYKKTTTDPTNPDNVSLLTANPTGVNGVWTGTVVSESPGKDKKESYNIDFKRTETDTTHTDDPKLNMKN